MDYNKIGNFVGYKHEPRIVIPAGLIKSEKLILKMYDMIIKGTEKQNPVESAKRFLNREIEKGAISPQTGMGFAILSGDMLNVGRWDTIYPIVVKNQLYEYLIDFEKDVERLSVDKVGAFCIWELGIVNYEKELWKRYLNSKRTKRDKLNYLESMIEEEL